VSGLAIAIIGVHLFATHLGDMNPGARRTLETPGAYLVLENGLTAGVYKNTLRRTSWIGGYTREVGGGWALSAGLVTGYPSTREGYSTDPSSKTPRVFLAASYRFGGDVGVRALWAPQRTQPISLSLEKHLYGL
jgi:hypothetical protein